MKFKLALFALSVVLTQQQTPKPEIVIDQAGNKGFGSNNLYKGQRNYWIGQGNVMVGEDNAVQGFDNQVLGGTNVVKGQVNTVNGKGNTINGQQNTIKGQNNLVFGSGNVVSSDLNADTFDFDFESRLPEWMRSSSKKSNKVIPKIKQNSAYNTYQTKPIISRPIPYVTYAPTLTTQVNNFIAQPEQQVTAQINNLVQIPSPISIQPLQTIQFEIPSISSQQIPSYQSKIQIKQSYSTPQSIFYTSILPPPAPINIPKAIPSNRNNDLRTQIQNEVQARLKAAFSKAGINR